MSGKLRSRPWSRKALIGCVGRTTTLMACIWLALIEPWPNGPQIDGLRTASRASWSSTVCLHGIPNAEDLS